MRPEIIVLPMVALMIWTMIVWLRLYVARIPSMRRLRVHPQKLATRAERKDVDLGRLEAQTNDNFMNLFELPVLFYALCLALFVTGNVDQVYITLAWAFVVLRVMHSLVHLTYNKVVHRFMIYVTGGFVLLAGILRFAVNLLLT